MAIYLAEKRTIIFYIYQIHFRPECSWRAPSQRHKYSPTLRPRPGIRGSLVLSQGEYGGRLGLSVLSSFKTLRSDGMVVASYGMTSTLRSGRLAGEREPGVLILPARLLSFTAANTYPSALQAA
jgi:hypothetical protein